jgi:tetratricopeptide (TPR) repeat protein
MTSIAVRRLAACCAIAQMLALSACGPSGGPRTPATVAPPVAPLDAAVELLNQGDEKGAQKLLRPLLRANPNDPRANVLLESLDQDPVELLGARSFAYTVQAGDTMLGLSQRFLGNRLKFYQLARYNHVEKPAALSAGTVLRIPGEPPRPAPAPRAEPAWTETPKAAPRARPKPKFPASSAAPAKVATDPAAAIKLRSLGLAALNQGKVADAVRLLRRASALDPANPLIARDLARAERIAQTVAARR